MHWVNGSARANHPREPWASGGDGDTVVHCRLDQLKGTAQEYRSQQATYEAAYQRAKKEFDLDIAYDIIDRCQSEQAINTLVDLVYYADRPVILAFPHVSFDDEEGDDDDGEIGEEPKNAIPFAYAGFLSEVLGSPVNETIFQSARVGRTHLPRWVRFLLQPLFEGAVDRNAAYILVDDVVSTGGTLAALRSYILRSGGSVAGTTALANNLGVNQKFGIADETANMLRSAYGHDLGRFWAETFGHGIDTLTEAEARFLLGAVQNEWPGVRAGPELLQRLRERINSAAAKFG